jgi:hypothetical protein
MGNQKRRREAIQATKRARQARRVENKAVNQNNLWDDCEYLYQQCTELLKTVEVVQIVISRPGLIDEIKNPVEFNDNLELFSRDSRDLSQRLSALHETHATRKGSAKTPDEFTAALDTHEQYVAFMELWRQSLQPTLNLVLEHTSEAELALMKKQQQNQIQAQAQDPNDNTPIDVVATDVQAESTN